MQAIASVKAFANEAFELGRYDVADRRVLTSALIAARRRAVFVAFFILALFGGIVIALWFGASLLQRGEITAGELTRFVLYTTFVAGAIGQAAELFSHVQKTVGALNAYASYRMIRPRMFTPRKRCRETPAFPPD